MMTDHQRRYIVSLRWMLRAAAFDNLLKLYGEPPREAQIEHYLGALKERYEDEHTP